MEKKTYLLSNLKKQVIALKTQLEKLQKHKHTTHKESQHHSRNHQSISQSSRFNSISFDCSDLDRGKKRCREYQSPFKNLSQIINQKSLMPRTPPCSIYRRRQYIKTCQNFSSQTPEHSKSRSRSPNPITGEGYKPQRKGLRICKKEKKKVVEKPSCRKHFDFYY